MGGPGARTIGNGRGSPGLAGGGCFSLFGLLFLAGGLAAGWFIYLVPLKRWMEARSWVETPCRIEAFDIRKSRGSKGSVSYRIECRYHYEFNGGSHTGERAAINDGADNIGDFHKRAAARIQSDREAGRDSVCFVNPRNPEEALLFRDFRPGLLFLASLFPSLFTLIGIGVMAGGVLQSAERSAFNGLMRRHPDEPWRWRPEWSDATIRPSKKARWIWPAGAAWMIVVQAPYVAALALSGDLLRALPAWIGLLPFCAGVFVLWNSLSKNAPQRQVAGAELHLEKSPLRPGDSLKGRLRLPLSDGDARTVLLIAECVNVELVGTGKGRRRRETVIWSGERALSVSEGERGIGSLDFSVSMAIPSDQPGSDPMALFNGPGVAWRLRVTLPEARAGAALPLPVF